MTELNPFGATSSGRDALAKVLVNIRKQAGCESWQEFVGRALIEADLELPEGTLKKMAPTPQYGRVPNPGLFYALHQWSSLRSRPFVFDNGEPITAVALMEVLYEVRKPTGERLEPRNGSRL